MKKFFSLVLALVMALSLTTVAWGADVAKIGDTPYATLAEALAVVPEDGTIELAAGTYTFPAGSAFVNRCTINCAEGVVFEGTSQLNIKGSTVIGATFSNPSGTAVTQTINGIFKNCTFTGSNALRYCYAGATVEFYNCVFEGAVYGVHFDGGANDVLFEDCTISGFNAFGGQLTNLTLDGCTFQAKEGNNYNGVNLWGDTVITDCTFVFDDTAGTQWVDMCGDNKTLTITDSVVTDGTNETSLLDVVGDYGEGNNATVDGDLVGAVAEVNGTQYKSLTEALKAVTSGATVTLLDDVTISETWDCRSTGAKFTVPVTIDGKGHTLKFTGKVYDANWNTVFRFEEPATVKNLTIDASAATDIQRGITSKLSIVVENFTFIGNGTTARYGVIFGEGADAAAIGNVTASVTGSTFKDAWVGVSDNQNGKDAKSVTVTDSTFTNTDVMLSASETVTFTGNTVDGGEVNISSYSDTNELKVTATGNTLDADEDNQIVAATITAQDGFLTPVGEVGGKYYTSLQDVVDKTAAGGTVTLLRDCDEDVTVGKALTFDFNGYTYTGFITPASGYSYMDGVVKKTPAATGTTSTGKVTSGTVTPVKAKMYRLATAGTSMTELNTKVTEIKLTTVTGKLVNDVPVYVPDIYSINGVYYVEVAKADATYALKNNGAYVYLAPAGTTSDVNAVIAKFATAVVLDQYVAAAEDVECGDAIKGTKGAAIYKSGNDAYYADGSDWAYFKGEFVKYNKNAKVDFQPHKWDAKSIIVKSTDVKGTKVPVTIECEKCEKTFSIVPSAKFDNTWVKGVNYTTDKAVDKYNTSAVKYYIVLENATYTGTYVPSVPSTDKVQSADTFDAGIAMYVSMSVMAAAGSAVVLKKRED